MARSVRIEYAGPYDHVMARGNRREVIFFDDDDRRGFFQVLAEACGQTGWQVHAWALMGNVSQALRRISWKELEKMLSPEFSNSFRQARV